MQLIGYMAVHNGAEFIEYSIRSTIPYCDRFIVIEGAWGENILANGQRRSTDGTLKILSDLKKEFPNLEVYQVNKKSQLEQRNVLFTLIDSPSWVWLIDHDEVYDDDNANKIQRLSTKGLFTKEKNLVECYQINSFTFINDFWHYVPISWNRMFFIDPKHKYRFEAPNHIYKDLEPLWVGIEEDIQYFHYSYLHSSERFLQKRRERLLLHGTFKWELDKNNNVYAPNTEAVLYNGKHPDIILGYKGIPKHPKYQERVL